MHTKLGYDYVGKASVTMKHHTDCQHVLQSPEAKYYRRYYDRVPDKYDPDTIGEYCRNVPGLEWEQPMCYAQDQEEPSKLTPQPCSVGYCGKCIYSKQLLLSMTTNILTDTFFHLNSLQFVTTQ